MSNEAFVGCAYYIPLSQPDMPKHVKPVYDMPRIEKVTNKLQEKLNNHKLLGIEAESLLKHVIGNQRGPFQLSGPPFKNKKSYRHGEMIETFLKQERAFATGVLEIIFGADDSVARNSKATTFTVAQTTLQFDFSTAFREAVVYYVATHPDDVYRVTITGVGEKTSHTFLFEPSEGWKIGRYLLKHPVVPVPVRGPAAVGGNHANGSSVANDAKPTKDDVAVLDSQEQPGFTPIHGTIARSSDQPGPRRHRPRRS